jgi:dTDP-4-dehydrorhamnose 3,5-epimerase
MLPGVKTLDLKRLPDERGSFAEIFRNDWTEFFEGDEIVQTNLSYSYPGMIRGWHHHERGQVDYFCVVQGSLKICAYDDAPASPTRGQLDELIASSERLQLVRIPGKYWHGTKALGPSPTLTVYMVNRRYDAKDPDEGRRPWNDPAIVDPRLHQPYDWNRPPHK